MRHPRQSWTGTYFVNMQKLQGWAEQGNIGLTIIGSPGTIARKVQGSFPGATVTVYLNNPAPQVAIVNLVRTANVVTVTVGAGSNFIAGQTVTVTNPTSSGIFTIVTGGSSSFTYNQVGADGSSAGGFAQSNLRLANIFADNGFAPTVKANPFTASLSDGTWFFYAANGRYDVNFSGGGLLAPFTLSDFLLFDDDDSLLSPIYDLIFALQGVTPQNTVYPWHTFARTVSFGLGWAGSVGSVGANPSGLNTFTLLNNGGPVGSIQVTSGGVVSFVGGPVTFSPTNRLTIQTPNVTDTIADISFTLAGVRIA